MNKIEQAGSDATSTPGKSSLTARVVSQGYEKKPSPVAGMMFTREEMEHEHRANMAALPYAVFERVMVNYGAIIVDEVA